MFLVAYFPEILQGHMLREARVQEQDAKFGYVTMRAALLLMIFPLKRYDNVRWYNIDLPKLSSCLADRCKH
jgi:hypothetical protein